MTSLFPCTSAAHQFQGIIPVNSKTVDLTSFVTNAVDQLVNAYSGLFPTLVMPWLRNGLLVSVVIAGCFWLFDSPVLGGRTLFRAILTYGVIDFLLRYYTNPLPLVGVPFSQIFRLEGKYLAGVIDISLLNVFAKNVSDLCPCRQAESI